MLRKEVLTEKKNNVDTLEVKRNNMILIYCLDIITYLPHHAHLEGISIEGSDFPVAADIVHKLHQAVQPENPRDYQHEDHKCIVPNAGGGNVSFTIRLKTSKSQITIHLQYIFTSKSYIK